MRILAAGGEHQVQVAAEFVVVGAAVQQPVDGVRGVAVVAGGLGNQIPQHGLGFHQILRPVAVQVERQRISQEIGAGLVLDDGLQQLLLGVGQLRRFHAVVPHKDLGVAVRHGVFGQHRLQQGDGPRLFTVVRTGDGQIAEGVKPIRPQRILLQVLVDERFEFVRLGGRVIQAVDQVVVRQLVVADGPRLLQALRGVGLLSDVAVVLGHQQVQLPL